MIQTSILHNSPWQEYITAVVGDKVVGYKKLTGLT